MTLPFYPGTQEEFRVGDRMSDDGHPGTIELICLPGTEQARNFACDEAGGLLVDFDSYGATLISFDMLDNKHILLVSRSGSGGRHPVATS